jgi:AcrR family transcriptional regulator
MPRPAAPTRKRILDSAYRLFRSRGYSRVSMDEIAAAARLTKRTLYHHFRSKDDLLADVLRAQDELALQAFRTFGDKLSGSAEAIVAGLFADLAVWADRPRFLGSGFTRLVIELADMPGHPARAIARRHKAKLEGCLADLLAESGVAQARELARAVWLLSEGAISLILVHGDRGYAAAAAKAAMTLVRHHAGAA